MDQTNTIIIAGAGGIAEAAALMLAEWSPIPVQLYLANRTVERAKELAEKIQQGTNRQTVVKAVHLTTDDNLPEETIDAFKEASVLLDCLPGSLAPQMARLALRFGLHYVNLTEHILETREIKSLAGDAQTGFVLQTGLAPGFVNIAAHGLLQLFQSRHHCETVDEIQMRVGALSRHAISPHFYGFTWSPAGVATEYIEPADVIRDFKQIRLPSLSELTYLMIDGEILEENLTSGGAADLPDAWTRIVRNLDYKTLRYPGHYGWVDKQLSYISPDADRIRMLQQIMEKEIPHVEEDRIVIYVAIQGPDDKGVLRREERSYNILPQRVGKIPLRAIQTTTAAPMVEMAVQLLQNRYQGIVLQSMIDPARFLNSSIIQRIYGPWED